MDLNKEFLDLRKKYINSVFNNLNDKQLEGITTVKGPILILAGAGSGKTTVLVNRIYNLIRFGDAYNSDKIYGEVVKGDIDKLNKLIDNDELTADFDLENLLEVNRIPAYKILAITFTNKAAKELRERIATRLSNDEQRVNAFTFHSLCMRILRCEGEHLGFNNQFTIYDMDDQKRVFKEIYKELTIDDKMLSMKYTMSVISKFKDQMLSPNECIKENETDYRKKLIVQAYARYQEKLLASNAMDFDDLIVNTVKLFSIHKDILEKYQHRYQYIMVDEYQDTNNIQYKLVSMLAEGHRNVCVVGDDDQSIYKFRGATIENILNFEGQFSNCKVIKLEQNYRSTKNILSSANSIICNNTKRKGKELWTSKDGGEKVTVHQCNNEREEVDYIITKMQDAVKSGIKLNDIAILYRLNAQSNVVEQGLAKSGFSYRVFGGLKFFDRKEIKDVLAYLILINNKNDDLRLKRVINEPKRGIGDITIEKAQNIAAGLGTSLFDVISEADSYDDLRRKSKELKKFSEFIIACQNLYSEISIYDLAVKVLEGSGYLEYIKNLGVEGQTRLENIEEFLSTIIAFQVENENGTLNDFLEEILLVTTMDDYNENSEYVTLMTVHSSKGLEFKYIFLVGLEEGLFPSDMSKDDEELVEEERRLCYVAVTRAKEKLYITNTQNRMIFGETKRRQPSRFISEMDKSFVEFTDNCITASVNSTYGKQNYGKKRQIGSTLSLGGVGITNVKRSTTGVKNTQSYSIGDKVKHTTFGTGVITVTLPMGNDTLLTIMFDSGTTKKIMANFGRLEKL